MSRDRPPVRPELWTAALSTALLGGGLLLLTVVVPLLPERPHSLSLPWWLLVPAFAVAELFVVHVTVGRSATALSFGVVPLVLGLAALSPDELLLASAVGSGVALARHQRGVKLLFNCSLWVFEVAFVVAVHRAVLAGAGITSPRGLLAVLVAMVASDVVTALAITVVIRIHERELDTSLLREAVTSGLVVAVANAAVGMLVVVVAVHEPFATVLLVVVVVLLAGAYRAHMNLYAGHLRLERVYAFTRSLGSSPDSDGVLESVLRGARELLQAERAEIHLVADRGVAARGLVLDDQGLREIAAGPDAWWSPARRGEEATVVVRQQGPGGDALRAQDGRDGVAVPLLTEDARVGVLLVRDRLAEIDTFCEEDRRLLEAFAAQAVVSLERGRLVDQVRQEAADREHAAAHDRLTGLPNREAFGRHLRDALDDGPCGVLLLDLDEFKEVNDALGHPAGDELLVAVGARLADVAPGVVARLGGDEFAVLVAGGEEEVAEAGRVVVAALEAPFPLGDVAVRVQASAGVVLAPQDGDQPTALLQRADVAMYRAKEDRAGVLRYDADADSSSADRLTLAADLRRAVDEESLTVAFQPKVDVATGAPRGAEALLRWHHPVHGHLPPDRFVALAERTGLVSALTSFVLRRSLETCAGWRAAGLDVGVSVNVSALDLRGPALVQQVADALQACGLPPPALTLEITETATMSDPEAAGRVLHALDALGVRLSVDDFGTGYSSLAYLRGMPVDEVKVDKAFVLRLATDPADRAVVAATVQLGHALGLQVVAEGVEDGASLAVLAELGCDVAQGYHLSRPVSAEQAEQWMTAVQARTEAPAGIDVPVPGVPATRRPAEAGATEVRPDVPAPVVGG